MAENDTPAAGDDQRHQRRTTTGAGATPVRANTEAAQSSGQSDGTESRESDGSLRSEMEALHKSRTTVEGRDDVDARLDSRTPDMLKAEPKPGPDDPKPQHVDGPDLLQQAEFTRDALQQKRS